MAKMGYDDYRNIHSLEDLEKRIGIEEVDIEDESFDPEKEWYEEWQKKKEEASDTPIIGRINCTDMGNAERLHLREAGNIKWSSDAGWRIYDGKRWVIDKTCQMLSRAAATVRKIYVEAAQTKDQERRETLGKWASKSEAAPRLNAMIDLCRPIDAVEQSVWDKNLWLLNLKNGTLNLETGEFREHRKEDLITKLIDVDYNPSALCPLWKTFLARVVPESEDRHFLQKAVGYSLTGSTREQCLLILYGLGANGKSTFINTIDSLLSDYAAQTNAETLMIKHGGQQIPNDVAALCGARFVCAVETEGGKRLAESLVKRMTGGDKLSARFLNHEFFTFIPTFKLWLAVNHQPRIHGTDEAIWRRIRLVPFTVTIPKDERDENLSKKLLAELPGILAWAIDGTAIWLSQKLGTTTSVDSATDLYRQQSDALNSFIEECCIVKEGAGVTKADLYEKYSDWGKKSGEYVLTKRNFGTRLSEKGFTDQKNERWFWVGITLNSTPNATPDPNLI